MKKTLALCMGGALLLAANLAFADPGYTTSTVNLRAGPDTDYPSIGVLPPGLEVSIEGCIDGWAWCDVIVDGDRGWVAGDFLQYEYESRRVLVRDYGSRAGIPIVTFALGTYWDRYYHDSRYTWYGDRDRWSHWSHGRPAPAVYHYSPRVYSRTVYIDHGGRNDHYDRNDHRNDHYDRGHDDHRNDHYDRGHDDHRNDHNDRGHDDHRNDHNDRGHDDHRNDRNDNVQVDHRNERNDHVQVDHTDRGQVDRRNDHNVRANDEHKNDRNDRAHDDRKGDQKNDRDDHDHR